MPRCFGVSPPDGLAVRRFSQGNLFGCLCEAPITYFDITQRFSLQVFTLSESSWDAIEELTLFKIALNPH